MTSRAVVAGAAALLLAAGCGSAPPALTDAHRAALADSVEQVATQMFASLASRADADTILSYFVGGDSLVVAEDGMLFPSYDSLVSALRATWRPGSTFRGSLGEKRVRVLSPDVVVVTAIISGTGADSAGVETPTRFAWTGVYLRTAGGWKIAARHESSAPQAPAAPARRR